MDYFVDSHDAGLMDLMGRAHVEMAPEWWLMGDFHYFTAAQDYMSDLDGEMTSDVGMEFDFTVKTKSLPGAGMMAGASFFLPKDAFAGTEDAETGTWYYFQFMVDFD